MIKKMEKKMNSQFQHRIRWNTNLTCYRNIENRDELNEVLEHHKLLSLEEISVGLRLLFLTPKAPKDSKKVLSNIFLKICESYFEYKNLEKANEDYRFWIKKLFTDNQTITSWTQYLVFSEIDKKPFEDKFKFIQFYKSNYTSDKHHKWVAQ
tara:strand:- start:33 stop:488 length:456 start_codon:yes stop_codon:yes gene_type:complete